MTNKVAILSIGLLLFINSVKGQDFPNPESNETPRSIDAILGPGTEHQFVPIDGTEKYGSSPKQPSSNTIDNTKQVDAVLSKFETDRNRPSVQASLEPRSYDPVTTHRDRFVKSPCFGELGFNPFMDVNRQEEMYRVCEEGKREKQFKEIGIITAVIIGLGVIIVIPIVTKKQPS